jgi:diguanylate cyclase (GGDEF)-like protein
MAASKRTGQYGAVMLLDLDNFKPLNDLHGHDAGDLLLVEVARRLKSCVRETDTVARVGGDEFVVLIGQLNTDPERSAAQASTMAEKIRAVLSQPYAFSIEHEGAAASTVEHRCTASIGVALFRGQEFTQDDVLKRADTAMYQAKESDRNTVRFYQ